MAGDDRTPQEVRLMAAADELRAFDWKSFLALVELALTVGPALTGVGAETREQGMVKLRALRDMGHAATALLDAAGRYDAADAHETAPADPALELARSSGDACTQDGREKITIISDGTVEGSGIVQWDGSVSWGLEELHFFQDPGPGPRTGQMKLMTRLGLHYVTLPAGEYPVASSGGRPEVVSADALDKPAPDR